jgi:hypothetical protein
MRNVQYAKINGNTVVEIATIDSMFPTENFAYIGPSDNFMMTNDVRYVVDYIDYDMDNQKLVYVDPYLQNDKVYTCQVVDLTDDEKTEIQNNKLTQRWTDVRHNRTEYLKMTDWTQLPDVPDVIKNKYTEYRQQLRDITKQSDPFNLDWPQEPV